MRQYSAARRVSRHATIVALLCSHHAPFSATACLLLAQYSNDWRTLFHVRHLLFVVIIRSECSAFFERNARRSSTRNDTANAAPRRRRCCCHQRANVQLQHLQLNQISQLQLALNSSSIRQVICDTLTRAMRHIRRRELQRGVSIGSTPLFDILQRYEEGTGTCLFSSNARTLVESCQIVSDRARTELELQL